MKLKSVLCTLVAMGAMALMAVGVQAATYSAGAVQAEDNSAVVPVVVTPDEGETEAVNGYVMTFTYDPSDVKPVVAADKDATGADCYATAGTEFTDGVLVSDVVSTSDTSETLAVAWASASPVSVTEATNMASVQFTVLDSSITSAPVTVSVVELTNDGTSVAEDGTYTVKSGEIDIASILYGDVDGDNLVTADDASLIAQHALNLIVLDSKYLVNANVDNDSVITADDASLVAQRALNLIGQFPIEEK